MHKNMLFEHNLPISASHSMLSTPQHRLFTMKTFHFIVLHRKPQIFTTDQGNLKIKFDI